MDELENKIMELLKRKPALDFFEIREEIKIEAEKLLDLLNKMEKNRKIFSRFKRKDDDTLSRVFAINNWEDLEL